MHTQNGHSTTTNGAESPPHAALRLPRLDDRLKAVAKQIRCRVHADIGSDHAHLLKALLTSGRIERGVAIEDKQQPFANSKSTLAGLNADVRFADGLAGLRAGEADSLSCCGMGGESMVRILEAFPGRVPPVVILQPNRRPELTRQWGLRRGFHLLDEQIARGHWPYCILRFERADASADPAYEGLDREAALLFGPHMIRRWQPDFVAQLREEWQYLNGLDRLNRGTTRRLEAIERLHPEEI